MLDEVDLVVLSRDAGRLRPQVDEAISAQKGVRLHVHRVIGEVQAGDACRWESIARARNQAKELGASPWLMLLDDDVVLASDCVRTLLDELTRRRRFGALAADYMGDQRRRHRARHVAMGATLFRRRALDRVTFRWQPNRCECQCCCDDLRRQGIGIAYCPQAIASHLARPSASLRHTDSCDTGSPNNTGPGLEPLVLTAFDRRHYRKFREQFLTSLRVSGNDERLTILGYGLYPSQQRSLARLRNVELLALPADRNVSPARRRLHDFQTAISQLDDETPVAHWDAGDVLFQGRLSPLWRMVRANPDKLLTTREPASDFQNPTIVSWTLSIRNRDARQHAFQLLRTPPWLTSGFVAGTTRTMMKYLQAAVRLSDSAALAGTTDWGDMTVFNFYCHSNPEAWQEIDERWNYCLMGRKRNEVYARPDGYIENRQATPIYVVHGNASTLPTIRGYGRVRQLLASRRRAVH